MNNNEILSVLQSWNFWGKDLDEIDVGNPRKMYLHKLNEMLQSGQVVSITGVRRSGKSFILRAFAKELMTKGRLSREILIVNFEDPRFDSELDAAFLEKIYQTYLREMMPKNKPVIFLDEVQKVLGWEKWVRMMHELNKAQIVITGSNADLLSGDLSSVLTGRHLDLKVMPLSFVEFSEFKKKAGEKVDFDEYLSQGGFPAAVFAINSNEIILQILDDIVEKDIIKRFNVRKEDKLKSLLRFYLSNISAQISYSALEKHLGLTGDTIAKFSRYFENVYLLFFLKRYSFKVKEQEKTTRKVYAIDTGLATAGGFQFAENSGRLLENVVFLELKRRTNFLLNTEIYYFQDQAHREVDFVVKKGHKIKELIQVCMTMSQFKTKSREFKGLLSGARELKCDNLLIITNEEEGEEKVHGKKIKIMPLAKWLVL